MSVQRKVLIPRVAVGSLSSPLEVGADRTPQAASDLAELLERLGCEVLRLGAICDPDRSVETGRQAADWEADAVAFAVASWFEDYLVLDFWEECQVPVLLWSLPGMETGALCGSQQLTAYLKQLEIPYRGVYGPLHSDNAQQQARTFLRASSLKHYLRRARIGFGGHRVTGMTEVSANEFSLKKVIGPRIVPLDLPQMLERAREMPTKQARQEWAKLARRAATCHALEEDGLDSMQVYAAVKELVDQHGLSALTIGCYPHLMGRVCLAASLLADEGIPLGCEGDVNGVVGQLMLTLLTGQPTHNTDWLEPLEDGSVILTHCGSGSLTLAENPMDITLAPVRLMEKGVCALFPARPGPVTLVSLLPCGDKYQLAVLEGEAISTSMVFPGNPLRVRFDCPVERLITWIHDEGIGHHWMAGYGHVGDEIREWARIVTADVRIIPCPKTTR